MKRRPFLLVMLVIILTVIGCIKETYDMNKLSKMMHLSPTMAISAANGNITLGEMVKSSDTVVYGQDKFLKLIFKQDSVIDFKLSDFAKGPGQLTATIAPDTLDLNIDDILKNLQGDIRISNPSIKFNYINSITYPAQIKLNVTGKRNSKTVDLNLAPFSLLHPAAPADPATIATFLIDKSNSSLVDLVSLPPGKVYFSGTVTLTTSKSDAQVVNNVFGSNHLFAGLEIEIPTEFRLNNVQFKDTVKNFMKDDNGNSDDKLKPENFKLLRINLKAKNGFPLGVAIKMSLYDSVNDKVKSTVDATDVLKPALVDSNGKVTGITETSTTIEFTKEFFSFVNASDKIIFQFTLNSTGNGSQDVKIYSDYRIDFNASLVLKPDISLN